MSTQPDIYAAGSENHPSMLNKDNYVPWSSRIIRMIATPGEPDVLVPVPESFHEQTDEELTENDIKRIDAYDQAIQTILLGLLEDEKFTSTDGESIESYYHRFMQLMNDLKRNKHFPENIAANLKFLNNLQPEWKRHVTIVHQTKNLHEDDFTQIYDFLKMNQDDVNELRAEHLVKTHDPLALMSHSKNSYNFPATHIVPWIANQNGTGNIIAARAEGTRNENQARLLLLIAKKEEAGILLQAEEFDFMATAGDLDEIEEVNANCILMANLQHASTSSTQRDKASIYDTNSSAKVQLNGNYYDNEIFNMFTQEEQYTDLLEPIPEPQLVPHNDNHVTYVSLSMV
nr:hypothetical protein [Tanacetum cinerariifolium]